MNVVKFIDTSKKPVDAPPGCEILHTERMFLGLRVPFSLVRSSTVKYAGELYSYAREMRDSDGRPWLLYHRCYRPRSES